MGKTLKTFMVVTDVGFLIYWLITWLHLVPKEYLYKNYDNELMVAWNVSFVPLDLLISCTGLLSMYFFRRNKGLWQPLCIISLTLTFCSGLQAIAFWAIQMDLDWFWWIPNLFLMIYPLFFLPGIMKFGGENDERKDHSSLGG
ncbi:hypothetical protein GCM10010912_09920 [Paenibacillus albidus]|uniref:YvaD family protein n=1 Tax=Paenibacillus albidus TaxID=2041023 RepID=A0A917FE59_9BACL|nr:YvaD family protein [Paenibacillus albidus]GGF66964.1 hypothetical protein GCM10010912_09920 [Paenibacillus albidus]